MKMFNMKKSVSFILATAMLCLGVYSSAGVLPSPDKGTSVQDFRLSSDGVNYYGDWDAFVPYYSGNNVTIERGPNCEFFTTYNPGGSAAYTKTYWKDAKYDVLTGYISDGIHDWSSASASRVSRTSTIYQLRVKADRYTLTYPCCGGDLAKLKISRSYGTGYYYSYTQTLRSQVDGPNCK